MSSQKLSTHHLHYTCIHTIKFIDFHTNWNPFTFRYCWLFFFSIYRFFLLCFLSLSLPIIHHSEPVCVCNLFADCRYLFILFIRDVHFISLVSTSSIYTFVYILYVYLYNKYTYIPKKNYDTWKIFSHFWLKKKR